MEASKDAKGDVEMKDASKDEKKVEEKKEPKDPFYRKTSYLTILDFRKNLSLLEKAVRDKDIR